MRKNLSYWRWKMACLCLVGLFYFTPTLQAEAQQRRRINSSTLNGLVPPQQGFYEQESRIHSLRRWAGKASRNTGIVEPRYWSSPTRFGQSAGKRDHDCVSQDLATLSGVALVDYLVDHDVPNCLSLFMFDFDENLEQVFNDANMQAVFLAVQDRIPSYDGTNNVGLHQLFYFAHAGYFHEFFQQSIGPFNTMTRDSAIAASRDFELNTHIYDLGEEAADILGEWLIVLDNPGLREHFVSALKQVLRNMTPERAESFTQRWAYNSVFFLMFRGIVNGDAAYQAALVADGEMPSVLKQAALYEYLFPDHSFLVENAIGELGRLAEITFFREEVTESLIDLLDVYPRLSPPHLKAIIGLDGLADCAPLGICGIEEEVKALAFPNRFVFDDGAMVFETPLELEVVQVLYHAAKQAQSQLFRLIESTSPVEADENNSLVMKIYGSRQAYENYQGFLFDLPTDNGGIYIESGATFYTYQRTPRESIFSLEDLFRHEYIHYLAGRYIIHGLFGQTDFYNDCALTWFDEGLAEFLAGSTQGAGVQLRRAIVQNVDNDGEDRMTIDTTIGSCYSSGFKFYKYSSMFFSYLYEQDRSTLKGIIDAIVTDDLPVYLALLDDVQSDTGLELNYQSFLDTHIAGISQLEDPATSFPALVALTTDSPLGIESTFRELSTDALAGCSVNASALNNRFGCVGTASFMDQDIQSSGSANHYLNGVLDSWIQAGNAHVATNNFEGMNCHFSEIVAPGAGTSGTFSTMYACIGPLREPGTALDSDQDGTSDDLDDFPQDVLGWNDANGNGILDPDEIPDSDGDGMPDGYEIMFGFDPNNPADALEDADSDLINNVTEYEHGTNPTDANSAPATVDLVTTLRNDSHVPERDVTGSVVFYVALRFGGEIASNSKLMYSSTRPLRIENVNTGGAECEPFELSEFEGTLDCGDQTDGSNGLNIFYTVTPLQACEMEFTAEWTSDEVELFPGDNAVTLSLEIAGCPSQIPEIPVITASDSTFTDRIEITWANSDETRFYEIFRSLANDSTNAALLDTVSTAHFTDDTVTSHETHYYWTKACNDLGCSDFSQSDEGSLAVFGVAVEGLDDVLPNEFKLSPNVPNPFLDATEIRYDLPTSAHVSITIYDALGREVSRLVDEEHAAGRYRVRFEASGLQSGVYLYRIQADGFVQSGKMVLIR